MTRPILSTFPDALDPFQELPDDHSGLDFAYGPGRVRDDNTVADVAAGTVTLADDDTNYVEVTGAGAVSANTAGFTAGRIPLYEVVTASTAITSVTDRRALLSVPGSGGGGGGIVRSAHTTLTNTTTTGTTAIQWGTEEATIPDADLPAGDVTVLVFVEGQIDASSLGSPDRGRIKIEASYDGGATWANISSGEPILTIGSTSNDRGPWFVHHAHGSGVKSGDVMVRAMIRRNDTVNLSFEQGRLTLMAFATA